MFPRIPTSQYLFQGQILQVLTTKSSALPYITPFNSWTFLIYRKCRIVQTVTGAPRRRNPKKSSPMSQVTAVTHLEIFRLCLEIERFHMFSALPTICHTARGVPFASDASANRFDGRGKLSHFVLFDMDDVVLVVLRRYPCGRLCPGPPFAFSPSRRPFLL